MNSLCAKASRFGEEEDLDIVKVKILYNDSDGELNLQRLNYA